MADEIYATLHDLRKLFKPGKYDENWNELAEESLADCSAVLRQIFRGAGLNIADRIEEGKLEKRLLKRIICEMVKRVLSATDSPFASEMTSITQSATDYSTSISLADGSGNLYLKKAELKWLGLPNTVFGHIKLNHAQDWSERK